MEKISRTVKECYADFETFCQAYSAYYSGFARASLLTGVPTQAEACGDHLEEGMYEIWEEDWSMEKTFSSLHLPDRVLFRNPGESEPPWLRGPEQKPYELGEDD